MIPIKDSGERTVFDSGAQRDNGELKGNPSLIPISFLQRLSYHLELGAIKYAPRNWEKGMPLSRYVDGIYRHLWAFMSGRNDENHLAALAFNVMGLSHTYDLIRAGQLSKEFNDLPNINMTTDKFPLDSLFLEDRTPITERKELMENALDIYMREIKPPNPERKFRDIALVYCNIMSDSESDAKGILARDGWDIEKMEQEN